MPSPSTNDNGWPGDSWRGWYDIQGCGKCNDFCRWVGAGNIHGGDPNIKLTIVDSYWSCRRAGTVETYSPSGSLDYVKSWVKCAHKGAVSPGNVIKLPYGDI